MGQRLPVVIPSSERGDALACPGEVPLADVQQDEDRLLGQEAEAADRLLVLRLERGVTDRRSLLQRRFQSPEDRLLALVRLPLGGRAVAATRLQAFQAPVDEGQVGA